MTDTLHQEPERDQFKTESPIRAFTSWTAQGRYALGKGFRPSLAHVIPYLNAMEAKEGWQIVQVLEADTQTPSFLFRQSYVVPDDVLIERLRGDDGFKQQVRDLLQGEQGERVHLTLSCDTTPMKVGIGLRQITGDMMTAYESHTKHGDDYVGHHEDIAEWMDRINGYAAELGVHEEPYVRNREGFEEAAAKIDAMRDHAERFTDDVDPASRDPLPPIEAIGDILERVNLKGEVLERVVASTGERLPPIEAIGGDDPINPKHYGGTACAEIGELLSANSYQVLKYNWRLGEKDSPCVEIGKALWYLDRELALISEGHTFIPGDDRLPDHTFFDLRLEGRSEHTVKVARSLISWNRYGNPETLKLLRRVLDSTLDSYNGCNDWGSGLAI